MVRNRVNVAMIAEEDIEDLLEEWKQVPGWIKAHVKAQRPAHRYEGELVAEDGQLVFAARDIKEGGRLEMTIPFEGITSLGLGFSEKMKNDIDLAFGAGGPVPFVMDYMSGGSSQTLYFTILGNHSTAHANVDNAQWYETLDRMIARRPPARQRSRRLATAW